MQVSSPRAPVHSQNGILMSLWRAPLIAFAILMCVWKRWCARVCVVQDRCTCVCSCMNHMNRMTHCCIRAQLGDQKSLICSHFLYSLPPWQSCHLNQYSSLPCWNVNLNPIAEIPHHRMIYSIKLPWFHLLYIQLYSISQSTFWKPGNIELLL